MILPFFTPAWPAPVSVKAYSTLRYPGQSQGSYAGFNLALHVGDDPSHVQANRQKLVKLADLPEEPRWLNQTHSDVALMAEMVSRVIPPEADASYTRQPQVICVVMTADCLPILVAHQKGEEVAAIHAGWRGLAKGVVENTLSALHSQPESLLIWVGPSMQPAYYEVGEEVYAAFADSHTPQEMKEAFIPQHTLLRKWQANIPLLALQRLRRSGVKKENIYLSDECTYAYPKKYFSFRRDGMTGRVASLIFMEDR